MNDQTAAELSKNAIRERAATFMKRWKGTTSEQGERQTFWNEFFAIFGLDRKQVAVFEEIAQRSSTGNVGWIDLLYPGQMAVEHKSAGKNLDEAMGQLVDYLPSLHKSVTPWLLVVSDFEHFQWMNLESGGAGTFPLADLGDHLDLFWWMAGHAAPNETYEDEEEANLVATGLLATLHDRLADSGYDPHALREWLTRILFCLFADDTEVWDRAAFHAWIAKNTRIDGSDLGSSIAHLFQVLNTPPGSRPKNLDEDLAAFTYINGDLFANTLPIASCDEATRNALLDACRFDWSVLSPVIFGSLFQNIVEPADRRQLGAHYTSEENILRTIGPLFLDDLWAELEAATSKPKLQAFHDKLGSLTFMDPACGCGNFLVLAYRELRRLETETLRRLAAKDKKQRKGQRATSLDLLCKVKVDQFYGIELDEWPARIARTAMYLIDHIANREVSAEFGEHYIRFPIPAAPHIVNDNALTVDWKSITTEVDFLFGNPPFVDRKKRSAEQKSVHKAVHGNSKGHGNLDFVTGWFVKAVDYLEPDHGRAAFVATNSITQGQSVPALWPKLLAAGATIDFAHRSFQWTNEAKGKAHVQVVIIGLSKTGRPKTRLFDYPDTKGQPVEAVVSSISPYLTDNKPIIVMTARRPLVAGIPAATYGSTAGDGKFLTFDNDTVSVPRADPVAKKYLRRYMGVDEFISGVPGWCLWLEDADLSEIKKSSYLMGLLAGVKKYRKSSSRAQTQKAADTPGSLLEARGAKGKYLFVPCVSSERREYIPLDFFDEGTIVRASSWFIEGADTYLFGILQSAMFMAWIKTIGGRLESRYQVSSSTVYNTFPFPKVTNDARSKVVDAAQSLLDVRAARKEAFDLLYDPELMPKELRKAHTTLDKAVDAAFAPRRKFTGDEDRLALLLDQYEKLTAPLTASNGKGRRRT